MERSGRQVDIRSRDGFDSEQLLATPELQDVAGKVVRIIRGNGGRELLASTLRERGATVEYLEVYERVLPDYEDSELAGIVDRWRNGEIDVVTIMSVETLVNLITILPKACRNRLRQTLLVTPAERVIIEAKKQLQGIPTALAAGTSPEDIVRAIARHVHGHPE